MNQRPAYPSLPQAWGIFVIFIGVSLIFGVGISAIHEALNAENLSVGNFLGYNLSMMFIIWFAWRNFRIGSSQVFHFKRVESILYPLIFLLTISLAIVLDPLTNLIPMPDFVKEIFEQLSKKDIWTFLMVCISGPILEELLFRGIMLDGFLRRYNPGKAIFWSAFLFGLFHLNPWQFIPGFLSGLLIGYIYFRTRSLITAILIHIVNNSFSYLVIFYFGEDIMSFEELFAEPGDYMLFFLAGLLVFILSLFFIYRIIIKSDTTWTLNSETGFSSSPAQAADSDEPLQ